MENIVFAVVRNVYRAKRYGFARLESGEDIFFHFNDRRAVVHDRDVPKYISEDSKDTQIPMRGNEICLYIGVDGSGRKKARIWGFVEKRWTEKQHLEYAQANRDYLEQVRDENS